jgi:hypothetical protein
MLSIDLPKGVSIAFSDENRLAEMALCNVFGDR